MKTPGFTAESSLCFASTPYKTKCRHHSDRSDHTSIIPQIRRKIMTSERKLGCGDCNVIHRRQWLGREECKYEVCDLYIDTSKGTVSLECRVEHRSDICIHHPETKWPDDILFS